MKHRLGKNTLFAQFSHKLTQLFQDAPFALAILDTAMHYVHVNECMAAINALAPEDHLGKTLRDATPGVASLLEPIVRHALEEGTALVDLETEIAADAGIPEMEHGFWRIGCYLLRSEQGVVEGAGVIVRDITEQKTRDAAQEERLKFESFLSEFSAAFINVPVSEVDSKLELGLQKVAEFLGFDRCSMWQFMPDTDQLILTHSYALPGIKQPPPSVDDRVPVWTSMWKRGEMFRVSDVDELPDNLWREKKYCREMGGIKSFLFIPLSMGGGVVGLLSFASYHVERGWSDLLVQRLKLLGDVFLNALERKWADQTIQKALAEIKGLTDRLEAENHLLRDQIMLEQKHDEILGKSDGIRKVLVQVEQVAATGSTVLVLGETGTGKELIARAIHRLSGRNKQAMIKVNCAALPQTLIEAELFGREKGAYTGASSTQIGRFEAASGSTIFLDEVGELPLDLQAKLLRVLQEGQLERLGSPRPIKVDVRVIAATNRDLAQAVREGKFRQDLYYRLNVFPISLPPLSERSDDIPLLVWSMVKEFSPRFSKSIDRIPKKVMDALQSYGWPGNIRELRNVVERAMILSSDGTLHVDLPDRSATSVTPLSSLAEMETAHILSVLERTGWRVRGKDGAAALLELKPTTLESKMKKLAIKRRL